MGAVAFSKLSQSLRLNIEYWEHISSLIILPIRGHTQSVNVSRNKEKEGKGLIEN